MYPVCYRGRMGSFFLISNKYVYSLKKLPHAKGHIKQIKEYRKRI